MNCFRLRPPSGFPARTFTRGSREGASAGPGPHRGHSRVGHASTADGQVRVGGRHPGSEMHGITGVRHAAWATVGHGGTETQRWVGCTHGCTGVRHPTTDGHGYADRGGRAAACCPHGGLTTVGQFQVGHSPTVGKAPAPWFTVSVPPLEPE